MRAYNTRMIEPASITIGAFVKHMLLASFGALAHAINAHRLGQTKGLMDFLLLTILSSFSGVMFALIAMYLTHNEYMTLAAAGSGGFLGVEGLTLLTTKVRDTLADAITKKVK